MTSITVAVFKLNQKFGADTTNARKLRDLLVRGLVRGEISGTGRMSVTMDSAQAFFAPSKEEKKVAA